MIEADLQRHYRVDLCDLWRGELSLRKIRVLLNGLPPESPTIAALNGTPGEAAHWSLTDLLLGRVLDEIANGRWQWESSHLKPSDRRKPPKSVMPGAKPAIPTIQPSQLGAFINTEPT